MNFIADGPNSAYHYNIPDPLVRVESDKKAAETIVSEKFAEYMLAANEQNVDKKGVQRAFGPLAGGLGDRVPQ